MVKFLEIHKCITLGEILLTKYMPAPLNLLLNRGSNLSQNSVNNAIHFTSTFPSNTMQDMEEENESQIHFLVHFIDHTLTRKKAGHPTSISTCKTK